MPRYILAALVAIASLAMHAGAACYPGWDATCQDNPLYSSRLGLNCEMHVVVDCELMVEIGFTASERDELILNCPCSCQIECGTWTNTPTSSPTELPTVSPTPEPSASPTLNPTKPPSHAPTASPTAAPSKSPTKLPTPSPSGSPTLAPSKKPSTPKPSASPTYSPSKKPTTSAPTSTPTKAPTKSPTLSSPPTEKAAVDPSLLAAARAELPPSSTNNGDENDDDVALWIVYSSAAAVGVAVAAFIVGFFLVKNTLQSKRLNNGGNDSGSQNKRARKDRSVSRTCSSHESHRSHSLKSIKDCPSAKVPINENNEEEDIADLEANIKPVISLCSSASKKSKARIPSVSGPYGGDGNDENVDMIGWNSGDEFEVALSPSNHAAKEEGEDQGAASKFFTSVASVIFPSATNDYFEKEEKDSLPSKEDIEMNKSVYSTKSTSNNTFNTFFRNLDVQVNEGADGSTCKPEAEMKTPSIQDRKKMATTPKQVSDITMSMHPTKLGGSHEGDEETVSEPKQLPMLGLNESQASRSASRSRSSRSTATSYNETVGTRDEATTEPSIEDADVDTQSKTEPKKKSGLFNKLFHKKAKPEEDEAALREVSKGRSSFLDDLAASEEGSTIRTEQDTIIRRTSSRKQSFLDNVMDEEGTFSMISGADGSTKQSTLKSKESTKGHSTKPSHDTRGTRQSIGTTSKISSKNKKSKRSTSTGRPPVRPPSIRNEDPIQSAKELLASQAAVEEPADGSKQGSKSGKTFFACGAELDAISTFSKSTYHDQTETLPVVYREDEIEPPEDKAKVSSLLSAYLSLGSKEDIAEVVEKANAAEAAPMASISVAAEGKSHKSRKSHRSRSKSATRSSHRNVPSQRSHRSRSTQRTRQHSIAARGTMPSQMGEEMGLEDVLAVSEEEESVKSSDSGARSRISVQKGLRRQGSSIKREGSSVRHGSTRTDKYGSTRTDTTEKIDNTSLTKLQNAEDAARAIMAGVREEEDTTYDGTAAGETVSTYATNHTGRSRRRRGTYDTYSTAGQQKEQKLSDALRDAFAPALDEPSTFSRNTTAQIDELSFISGDDTFSRISAGTAEDDIGSYEYRRGHTLRGMLG